MIKIRHGCFETNSSSTHAICIPNKLAYMPRHIDFGIGEYGWSVERPDPADYLYTAILDLYGETEEKLQEKLCRLKEMLNNNNISYTFEKPRWESWSNSSERYLSYGYIDHAGDTAELVEDLMKDEDLLLRFLSGGEICTGNDNGGNDEANELYDRAASDGWTTYWKGN